MLKLEEIINLLENDGDIKENVSLKTLTTLKVGGISKYVFYPKDVTSLKKALTLFKENNINYKIFGNGSNIIPSDKIYDGVIIKLSSLNNLKTNDEVIEELIKIAKLLREAHLEGENLGLTEEELAFYNAIALPENIHDFYDDETLIKITQELTDSLRKNRTIDWQKKESARAKMRSTIKRLLKKYDYPPEEMKGALDKVIAQCELWVDEVA